MIEYEVLGALTVKRDGQPVDDLAAMPRRLLALLLVRAGQPVSVQTAIDELWCGRPPRTARKALQVYVHQLRKAVGAQRLVHQPTGYGLALAPGELDAQTFEQLLRQASADLARGSRTDARVALYKALDLWRATPYQDMHDMTEVRDERDRLVELRRGLVEEVASLELELGQHDGLVPLLQTALDDSPYRENLHALLMLALYRSGRQAEALAVYRRLQQTLADELGLDPTAGLQRLHQQILRSDPDISPRPTPAAWVTPAQLPADVAYFAGRSTELAELAALTHTASAASPVVISAIAGAGGVGKTALALRWAHTMADQFPDGQLYANLRGWSTGGPVDPASVLTQFLHALGVESDRVPTKVDEATALYRSLMAPRRLLVLLDNARTAEQVRPLLPAGRSVVIITSRDKLAGLAVRDGARRLDLEVLTLEDALDVLRTVLGRARVDHELPAARELAILCSFLPLALRIAAADLTADPDRPLAAYVAQLATGDRLSMLEPEGDAQSGLRAVFGHSYAALDPDSQQMFRLLGLAPTQDFTVQSAAMTANVAPDHARQTLERLVGAHLIQRNHDDRYSLHDLLRLYARQLADTTDAEHERAAAVHRFLDLHLAMADAAARLLYPSRLRLRNSYEAIQHTQAISFSVEATARQWLDLERGNLLTAIKLTAADGPAEYAWRLVDALRGYLGMHPDLSEARSAVAAAVSAAANAKEPNGGCIAELSLSEILTVQGDHPASFEHLQRALECANEAEWQEAQASTHINLGGVLGVRMQLTEAERHLSAGLAIHRRLGIQKPALHTNLGLTLSALGRLRDAAQHEQLAATIYHDTRQRESEARVLVNLADTERQLGLLDTALARAEQALAYYRDLNLERDEMLALDGLAAIHRDADRLDHALGYAELAMQRATATANPQAVATVSTTLGTVLIAQGRNHEAIKHLQYAAEVADRNASRTDPHQCLAMAYLAIGDHEQALAHTDMALTFASSAGAKIFQAAAIATRAAIRLAQGDHNAAAQDAAMALEVYQDTGHYHGQRQASSILRLARITPL